MASVEQNKMFIHEFAVGSNVVWPNGIVSEVQAIDYDEGLLLDNCGGWHGAYDCSLCAPKEPEVEDDSWFTDYNSPASYHHY